MKEKYSGKEDELEPAASLEDLQKLMVDSVLVNVQRKEREEMKKMSDQIWSQRNHFKAEIMHKFDSLQNTPRSGTDKLNKLLAAGMLISLEEKKREQALI